MLCRAVLFCRDGYKVSLMSPIYLIFVAGYVVPFFFFITCVSGRKRRTGPGC